MRPAEPDSEPGVSFSGHPLHTIQGALRRAESNLDQARKRFSNHPSEHNRLAVQTWSVMADRARRLAWEHAGDNLRSIEDGEIDEAQGQGRQTRLLMA